MTRSLSEEIRKLIKPKLKAGDRVVTNDRFAALYVQQKSPRHGTVERVKPSGGLRVKWDDAKYVRAIDPSLVDQVEE